MVCCVSQSPKKNVICARNIFPWVANRKAEPPKQLQVCEVSGKALIQILIRRNRDLNAAAKGSPGFPKAISILIKGGVEK